MSIGCADRPPMALPGNDDDAGRELWSLAASLALHDGARQTVTMASSHRRGKVAARSNAPRVVGSGSTEPVSFSNVGEPPPRRMWIVARDPSLRHGKRAGAAIVMAEIEVPHEPLEPGPLGYRVRVVDYDAQSQAYFAPRWDPEARPPSRWRNGDPRLVDDPEFRAQHVYALVMRTLARFEFALGRRVGWAFKNHQLYVLPSALREANAFYDRRAHALLFGDFTGDSGRKVHTCLSHDIVVHEATHALIDGLRARYIEPAGPDQAAFHEGFADVVALLSVFALKDVVRVVVSDLADRVAESPRGKARRGRIRELIPASALGGGRLRQSVLFKLAPEFGQESDGVANEVDALRGQALRHSVGLDPDRTLLDTRVEAHDRGEVFCAAVMHTFLRGWEKRLRTLGAIARGGANGISLDRIVEEGAALADHLLTMWIRALDYMPPVDLRFDEALSAALLADEKVNRPDERFGCRAILQQVFGEFGIRPAAVARSWRIDPRVTELDYRGLHLDSLRGNPDEVYRFLWANQDALGVASDVYCHVQSVRPCTRVGADGFVVRETVAEYYQTIALTRGELSARRQGQGAADDGDDDDDGLPPDSATEGAEVRVRGGGVLVFDEFGRLELHIAKELSVSDDEAALYGQTQLGSGSFAHLHRRRASRSRSHSREQW